MHEGELRRAALHLDQRLRNLKFEAGKYSFETGNVTVHHPLDIDCRPDFNYLVYEFEADLPPYFLHQSVQSCATYAKVLSVLGVAPTTARKWVESLGNKVDGFRGRKDKLPFYMKVLRIVWFLLKPILIFIALVSHFREGLPISRLSERFGYVFSQSFKMPTVWLHAASLGEVKQLRKILSELSQIGGVSILVTTFTKSSADWIAAEFPNVKHQYAVVDSAQTVRRFLNFWQPKILIIAENEIWPEMIIQSAKRDILLLKIGVRPSRTLHALPKMTNYLLNLFYKVTCTSPNMKEELKSIGVNGNRIVICADQRNANAILPVDESTLNEVSGQIEGRKLWLAASTHEADLEIVLTAQALIAAQENTLLILAPRHPRTAEAIKRNCKLRGLNVAQRSMNDDISKTTNVYLADTFGELGTFFSLSSVVYLGGGIGAEGGHNPYEPASFGCEILSGPLVANFTEAFTAVAAKTKVTFIETPEQLAAAIMAHEVSQHARPVFQTFGAAANAFQTEVSDVVLVALDNTFPLLFGQNGTEF